MNTGHRIHAGLILVLCISAATYAQVSRRVGSLSEDVRIVFDEHDVPSIMAESEADAMYGLGFAHARHRYFQMDILRRQGAGELSGLFGPLALERDRRMSGLLPRRAGAAMIEDLPPGDRALVDAYVRGVNEGLSSLSQVPYEYRMLNVIPESWTASDTVMIYLALFDMLNGSGRHEKDCQLLADGAPPEYVRFLSAPIDRFDVPLLPDSGPDVPLRPPVPGVDVIDLRIMGITREDTVPTWEPDTWKPEQFAGSNNWAVSGSRTVHGGAILASDPHMMITVPGIWYRAKISWEGTEVIGLTCPGLLPVLVGSNGYVAWGLTNTQGDFQDMVIIEDDPNSPGHYLIPGGSEPYEEVVVTKKVRGGDDVDLAVLNTRWGPVTGQDDLGRPLAMAWTALTRGMVNVEILRMAEAQTMEEAIDIGSRWYGPSQNLMIASSDGRIGWIVTGFFPRRIGFTGRVPVSRADGTCRWDGGIDEAMRPRLVDPSCGYLYTANNRTVDPVWADELGIVVAMADRAHRIHQVLAADSSVTEHEMLALQLDTRLNRYDLYRDILLETINRQGVPSDRPLEKVIKEWNGTADADQIALPVLNSWRLAIHRNMADNLLHWMPGGRRISHRSVIREEAVMQLLEERPSHMLSSRWENWEQFLDDVLDIVREQHPTGVELTQWGDVNMSRIQHPMSMAMGRLVGRRLDLSPHPQPGHFNAVRVANPRFGASTRMVVSPGRETSGLLQTPAGQSGDPGSRHYDDFHPAWRYGLPQPFLPGSAVRAYDLLAAGASR